MSSVLISKKRSIDEIVGEEEDYSFPEYTEPNYPITKSELFDEDNKKYLLQDTRFNKQDRKRLTDYNKHRQSGGQMLVQYKLANGCEECMLERLYPNDGLRFDSIYAIRLQKRITGMSIWKMHIIVSRKDGVISTIFRVRS